MGRFVISCVIFLVDILLSILLGWELHKKFGSLKGDKEDVQKDKTTQ